MHYEIFVKVVDNYGDVGVAWRLAEQLVKVGYSIIIYCDRIDLLSKLRGENKSIDQIYNFPTNLNDYLACQAEEKKIDKLVVIESFACNLPDCLIDYFAQKNVIWINLEYLALESWADTCHLLPSLPTDIKRLQLKKYFYFPGFNLSCGGLLRDNEKINSYQLKAEKNDKSWEFIKENFSSLAKQISATSWQQARKISFLSYNLVNSNNSNKLAEDFAKILNFWANNKQQQILFVASDQSKEFITNTISYLEYLPSTSLQINKIFSYKNLIIYPYSFISQDKFDQLLHCCNINFVRGEDSFVQAHWSKGLLIWMSYPQEIEARRNKLSSYLNLANVDLVLAKFYLIWNDREESSEILNSWMMIEVNWQNIIQKQNNWRHTLEKHQDLVTKLTQFIEKTL